MSYLKGRGDIIDDKRANNAVSSPCMSASSSFVTKMVTSSEVNRTMHGVRPSVAARVLASISLRCKKRKGNSKPHRHALTVRFSDTMLCDNSQSAQDVRLIASNYIGQFTDKSTIGVIDADHLKACIGHLTDLYRFGL